MNRHLFNSDKLSYVQGDKPDLPCILCALRDRDPEVKSLEVYRDKNFIVAVNLFPFNPGHLMIFPLRHIEGIDELSDDEALSMHHLFSRTLEILKKEFNPTGFNAGYNIGNNSGASISHLHLHVVPRFENEIGFLQVLSGTGLVVSDPVQVMKRLKAYFKE